MQRKASARGDLWAKLRWPVLALGLVLVYNFFFTPGFLRLSSEQGQLYGSLVDVFNRGAPLMLLAIGMTLVIATGGVDLSVGAVMAIAGSLSAILLTHAHYPWWLTGAIVLLSTAGAGAWNGLLIAYLGMQPIVATLILMVAGRGIAQLLTNGQIITLQDSGFAFIGGGSFLGLPFSVTIVAVVLAATVLFVRQSAAGLFIEAAGDNAVASHYAGVNTGLVKLLAYTFSGFCAGVAGLIVASDIQAADANNAGLWLELDAILAVVIGGTALIGGRFYLFSSVAGAILIQTLTTTILTKGVPVEFTLVVKAIVIIAVCLLQSETFRRALLSYRKDRP